MSWGKVLKFWARSQPGLLVCLRLILPSLLAGDLLEILVSYMLNAQPCKRISDIPSVASPPQMSCHWHTWLPLIPQLAAKGSAGGEVDSPSPHPYPRVLVAQVWSPEEVHDVISHQTKFPLPDTLSESLRPLKTLLLA